MTALARTGDVARRLLRRCRAALLVLLGDQADNRTIDVSLDEMRETVELAFIGIGLDGQRWASYATSDELRCLANCAHFAQILRERDWQAVEAMRSANPVPASGPPAR